MKKIISLSSILAVLLSQAGCVGGGNAQPEESAVQFPYATQEIKQYLAEQLLGEKGPIPADYFETLNYTPIMKQFMERGPSVFGEKEAQQVFWYYVMRLRMLTMYYTYPRAVDDWGILVEQLNALGEPARAFIEQHPQEGQEIFSSVIAYEEAHPYNPQKGIDDRRTQLKAALQKAQQPAAKEESQPATKQPATPGIIVLDGENAGEEIRMPFEEFKNLSRQEFKNLLGDEPKGEIDALSDTDFERVKQAIIECYQLFELDIETLEPWQFIERAEALKERYSDLLKQGIIHMDVNMSLSVTIEEDKSKQLQEELDSLKDIPEPFGKVREQILQAFKNDLAQMQSGLSPEEYAAQKKAELGITEYAIYLQAPKLFPAELLFAEFVLDPHHDEARYAFRKLFFSNNGVGGTRLENEKPLPHKVDMMWYSIVENKVYALQADLPYAAIKEKFIPQEEDAFLGLLLTVAPYGQVNVYVYNTISEEKELLGSFQAQEKQISLDDFRQAGALYESADNLADGWADYQQKALAAFPQAATLLAQIGVPEKDFDFWSDHIDIGKDYVLVAGAQLNALDRNGETQLICAVRRQQDALITKLLAAGADVNIHSSGSGETALSVACSMGYTGYVKQLVAAGADINQSETESGMTPLMLAARSGHIDIVKLLVEAGADMNAPHVMYGQEIGYNALKYAQENNHTEIVQFLLEKGAQEPAAVAPNTSLAPADSLDQALMMGDTAQVKKLLAQGADPNTPVPGIGPALFFACISGLQEAAQALLEAKADVNAVGDNGFTPLMMAAQTGNKALVQALLKAGADVNVPHQVNGQASGLNALKMAQNGGFTEIAKLLKFAGAKE